MASMNTRLNIEKLDENIVQKHGVGFKQLGPGVETRFHGIQDEKRVWFEVELQGAQGDHEAEVFQVSNDDVVVAQRRLEDKQLEEKINTDSLGAEGNVAEKKKVKESMKANLGKLLNYNAWSTRWSPDIRSKLNIEDGTISDIGEWQDDQWEAWKKEIWLKGHLTKSGYELSLVARIATGALVKGGSRSKVPAQVEGAAYRY
ncbi:hypothetical protein Tco_1047163 [Tanacetum coccineum]